jgi:hypothetical protein
MDISKLKLQVILNVEEMSINFLLNKRASYLFLLSKSGLLYPTNN